MAFVTTCERCGAGIKNVFTYNGKNYGSECIHIVTGKPVSYWELKNGEIDIEATSSREQKKADKVAEKKANDDKLKNEFTLKCEKYTSENSWLIELLLAQENDFYNSLADTIKSREIKSLSGGQLDALLKLYCKGTRYDSKKYWKKVEEFCNKAGVDEW